MTEDTEWVTIQEAADYLKVSTKTVRRYVTSGLLTAKRVGPRLIRLDAASVRDIGKGLG